MPRAKGGVVARRSHKKVMARAKGYFSRRKNVFRVAVQAVEKAEQYAYRDRRTKKRVFHQLWIARINAASRGLGILRPGRRNGHSAEQRNAVTALPTACGARQSGSTRSQG